MTTTDDDDGLLDRLKGGTRAASRPSFPPPGPAAEGGRVPARRTPPGRVSASDVLQEAYIDALKRLPHFQADPDVPVFIWLRTVTIQRLIETHRQHLGAKAQRRGAGSLA